jgi:hypothetical protein
MHRCGTTIEIEVKSSPQKSIHNNVLICYFLFVEFKYAKYCASFKILDYCKAELRN